jgi:hypothetical protein
MARPTVVQKVGVAGQPLKVGTLSRMLLGLTAAATNLPDSPNQPGPGYTFSKQQTLFSSPSISKVLSVFLNEIMTQAPDMVNSCS